MEYIPNLQPVIKDLLAGKWPVCPEVLLDRAMTQVQKDFEADAQALTAVQCLGLLKVLKAHRQFQACVALGRRAADVYPNELALRLPYFQGLIELGRLDDAESLIDALLARDLTGYLKIAKEINGMKGRVNKQRMVEARKLDGGVPVKALHAAIDAYENLLRLTPGELDVWAGINLIAMLATAISEQIGDIAGHQQRLSALKTELIEQVTSVASCDNFESLTYWDAASAAEAELADRNGAMAELWLWRALACKDVDPFSISSTLRQLREIHVPLAGRKGQAMKAVSRLIEILESVQARQGLVEISDALREQFELVKHQREVDPAAKDEASTKLEKVFGRERFIGFDKLRTIFSQCEAVGRVERRLEDGTYRGVGTGFLFTGRKLSAALPDELLFMTNAHVISNVVAEALRPEDAVVRFELVARKLGASYQPHPVQALIVSQPPSSLDGLPSDQTLDFSIVRLAKLPSEARPAALSQEVPSMDNQRDPNSEFAAARAYVLGHPEGDGLQISLHDSEIIDIDEAAMVVHYRTPTLGGNSGSPVLNAAGKVFALHHAGSEQLMPLNGQRLRYPGNEGMTLKAIGAAVTRMLS